MRFRDRAEAGRKLAEKLRVYAGQDAVVFAIPRGGVATAAEVAHVLRIPLDLVIVRKVGAPGNPEYALCVVAEDGDTLCHEDERSSVDVQWLHDAIAAEREEAKRRREAYLADRARPPVRGKTAIVVDDGIATGLTMIAALREVRHLGPSRVVAAVPVAPKEELAGLRAEADDVIVLFADPQYRGGVAAYYDVFPQLRDSEVTRLLNP